MHNADIKAMPWLALLALLAVAPTASFAEDKIAKVTADESQKRSERKAALAVEDIGLQANAVTLKASICKPKGKKTVCADVAGGWKYRIGARLEANVAKEIMDWIVTQRLDKLSISGSKVRLTTANAEVEMTAPSVAGFSFDVGKHEEFKAAADKWLAAGAGKLVHDILAVGKDLRGKELKNQERGTFMATRAKQLGLPPVILEKLMNSAYAFFVYLDAPTGSATVTIGTKKVSRGGKIVEVPSYSGSVSLSSTARVSVLDYSEKDNKFIQYSELVGETGFGGVSSSRSFDHMPSPEELAPLFAESLMVSVKAVGINLNTILKDDENFALYFVADSVEDGIVSSDVGVMEDIRVDAPGMVSREVDGTKVTVGFMKARNVGMNCKGRLPTTFDLISGETEMGDQVREQAWTGLLVNGNAGLTNYELTSFAGDDAKGGGGFTAVSLGVQLDLGYAANSNALSEVWFEMGFGLGFGGDEFSVNGSPSPLLIKFDLGARKRLYLGSSALFLAPGLDFGFVGMSGTDGELTTSVSSLALTPGVQLGYNVSPNVEITAVLGWALPLSTSGSTKFGDNDPVDWDAEVSAGLQFGLRLSFHSPVVGPLARLYAKPSTICRTMAAEAKAKAAAEKAGKGKTAPAGTAAPQPPATPAVDPSAAPAPETAPAAPAPAPAAPAPAPAALPAPAPTPAG